MARIISHPFRLALDGSVAAVEQGGGQGQAEQLAVLVLTRRGERPLVPAFGITDPTFHRLQLSEVQDGVELFGPPVLLEDLTVEVPSAARHDVALSFRPL